MPDFKFFVTQFSLNVYFLKTNDELNYNTDKNCSNNCTKFKLEYFMCYKLKYIKQNCNW